MTWASDKRQGDGKPSAYGWHVKVNHEGEYYQSWYCHLKSLAVKVDDVVEKGDILGPAGSTGNSTGVHLHFNIRKQGHYAGVGYAPSDVVDPYPLLTNTAPLGTAKLGLHAAADPGDLSEAEFQLFQLAKPDCIKVLSAHSGASIARLSNNHPNAPFIVRAFLNWGNRIITPQQFFDWTIGDVQRAVFSIPQGHEVWIELHNEPNLPSEGLGYSWQDGKGFNDWLLQVLGLYKNALQGVYYLYPGLSPGFTAYRPFLADSMPSALACDGVGVHTYWSSSYSMEQAITDTVVYYAQVFGNKPLWLTEASQNKCGITATQKGLQYLTFWNELKKRPSVKGVCYFVASASNPAFGWGTGGSCETWSNELAGVVGSR